MRRAVLALLTLAILALAQFSASVPAQALLCGVSMNGTCFAIATGNLNAGATWSNTSGGATCSATCTSGPTAGDTLVLDSASGSINVTLNVSLSVAVLDESGGSGGSGSPFTGTLTHASGITLTVSGNTFTLAAGSTYTLGSILTSALTFTSTSGTTTITPGGKMFGNTTLNGVGGTFSLGGDLLLNGNYVGGNNSGAGALTLTNGTFNANGHNVTIGQFLGNNTNTKTLTIGSGAWIVGCSAGSNNWNLTATGTTLSAYTGSLTFNCAFLSNSTNLTFGGNTLTYSSVTFGPSSVGGWFTIIGSNNFTSASVVGPVNIQFTNSTTQTITNAINWAGTSANPLLLFSSSVSRATLNLASGSTMSWAALEGIAITGATNTTATNSFDLRFNSMNGGTITAPSTGGGGVIGG